MRTRFWVRRPLALATALALTAILPACGGGSSGGGGNTPTTLPPQPTRTQIANGNFSVLGVPAANDLGFALDIAAGPLSVPGAGTLENVADWTIASSDIDIFFYSGNCSVSQAVRGQCTVIARTTSVTQKPERLTITNVAAGTYSLGFGNYSNVAEGGNYQVFLTR